MLLQTRRDEVPATVTKLRFPSVEAVDGVWAMAGLLRRCTPRWVCDMLRVVCYEKDGEGKRVTLLDALKVRLGGWMSRKLMA